MLAKVVELPLGKKAAELLDAIKCAQGLFKEIEAYYKRLLEERPGAIPGWGLVPGDVRRSIEDPILAMERLIEQFSVSEFLACCTPSVPALENAWAKKNNVPAAKARGEFNRFMGSLLLEKRNAPSLAKVQRN
jgi:hypothetical protein